MAEHIEMLLFLMGITCALTILAAKLRFPFPILLVLAGLVIGLLPRMPAIHLNPDLVFILILPPLLYSAAYVFPWGEFKLNLRPILLLAIGLVLVTMSSVALAAWWLLPGFTLAAGFVLGAIVSPPDAIAATAVMKRQKVPRRMISILEGESLVNDSSGLVAYQFAVAAVVTGTFSLASASVEFVYATLAGVAMGLLVGVIAEFVHKNMRDPSVQLTISLMTPYLAYLPAEKIGASGVLATVAAGLYIGHKSGLIFAPEARLQSKAVWGFMNYLINGLVFILIGLQFPDIMHALRGYTYWQLAWYASLVCGAVVVVRFLCVFSLPVLLGPLLDLFSKGVPSANRGVLTVVSWSGMRGVVSLAAALALPNLTHDGEPFPQRSLIIFLTFCVILFTLVVQGLTLPWLIRSLGLKVTEADSEAETHARLHLLERCLHDTEEEIHKTHNAADKAILHLLVDHYQTRADYLQRRQEIEAGEDAVSNAPVAFYRELAEKSRKRLLAMRDRGEISEATRRRIEYDLDTDEQRVLRSWKTGGAE